MEIIKPPTSMRYIVAIPGVRDIVINSSISHLKHSEKKKTSDEAAFKKLLAEIDRLSRIVHDEDRKPLAL